MRHVILTGLPGVLMATASADAMVQTPIVPAPVRAHIPNREDKLRMHYAGEKLISPGDPLFHVTLRHNNFEDAIR